MFDCTPVRSFAIIAEMITFRYCMSLSIRPRLFSSSTAPSSTTSCAASANPNLATLDGVAQVLKVEHNWLVHGVGVTLLDVTIVSRPATLLRL